MIKRKIQLCECGCGKEVTRRVKGMWKTHGVWNRFLPGHNVRVLDKETEERRRKKISETMKKRLAEHPEEIENRRKHSTGRRHSEASKKIMSKKAIIREIEKKENGYVVSEETREKLRKAFTGRKFTEETLLKMSIAQKGKIRSEELRKHLSKKLKEWHKTHENSFKGKQHSEKTKAKLRKAMKGVYTGNKASNWQGGISSFPYDINWTNQLRALIKKRDKNTCQNPECKNPHKLLDVHHIDYDKENSNPNNLITICKKCHGKTQKNRNYWKGYYKAIMNKNLKNK